MGFFDFFKAETGGNPSGSGNPLRAQLQSLRFKSTDHIRYQNGADVSGHNNGCNRGIEVVPNIRGGDGYTVTIHNLDGVHPLWGNNIQMAPKQMRIVREIKDQIELRGYGTDPMGASFSDYGITVHFANNEVDKVVLHMHDRHVDIVYMK